MYCIDDSNQVIFTMVETSAREVVVGVVVRVVATAEVVVVVTNICQII